MDAFMWFFESKFDQNHICISEVYQSQKDDEIVTHWEREVLLILRYFHAANTEIKRNEPDRFYVLYFGIKLRLLFWKSLVPKQISSRNFRIKYKNCFMTIV